MLQNLKKTIWYKRHRAARKINARPDHPEILMIQTITMCNAACSCCPYPGLTRAKAIPHGTMTDELFAKVVDEARGFDLKRVAPYWNNEPFLDPKFLPRLETLRRTFPKAVLHVSTNATKLEPDTWATVANCMDRLHISAQGGVTDRDSFERNFLKVNYDKYRVNVEGFLTFLAKGNHRLKLDKIAVNNVIAFPSSQARQEEELYWHKYGVSTNFGGFNSYFGTITIQPRRAGIAPGPIYGCADKDRPIQAMHVLHDGSCVLCCNDWTRTVIVGDASKDSLHDIWNSEAYRDQVAAIYSAKPCSNHMCCECDLAIH